MGLFVPIPRVNREIGMARSRVGWLWRDAKIRVYGGGLCVVAGLEAWLSADGGRMGVLCADETRC